MACMRARSIWYVYATSLGRAGWGNWRRGAPSAQAFAGSGEDGDNEGEEDGDGSEDDGAVDGLIEVGGDKSMMTVKRKVISRPAKSPWAKSPRVWVN